MYMAGPNHLPLLNIKRLRPLPPYAAPATILDVNGGHNGMISTTVSAIGLPHLKDISGTILLAFFCQSAASAEVS